MSNLIKRSFTLAEICLLIIHLFHHNNIPPLSAEICNWHIFWFHKFNFSWTPLELRKTTSKEIFPLRIFIDNYFWVYIWCRLWLLSFLLSKLILVSLNLTYMGLELIFDFGLKFISHISSFIGELLSAKYFIRAEWQWKRISYKKYLRKTFTNLKSANFYVLKDFREIASCSVMLKKWVITKTHWIFEF